jgi:hypothetical protein
MAYYNKFATNKQKLVKLSGDGFFWSEGDKKRLWLSGRGLVGAQNWTQYLMEGKKLVHSTCPAMLAYLKMENSFSILQKVVLPAI